MIAQRALPKLLAAAEFVTLRRRVEGEYAMPALAEWQRMKLRIALEVSEFVEILLVASQSDLIGPVPFSMERMAREMFGLRALNPIPRTRADSHQARLASGGAMPTPRMRSCAVSLRASARAAATGPAAG